MALTKIDDRGLTTPIDLLDNEKIRFGTGNDLEIFHDGSNSYIKDVGTGILQLNTNYLQVKNADDNEFIIQASQNGAVSLYYDNSKKFETASYGAITTGIHKVQGAEGGNAELWLQADEGDDDADNWLIYHDASDNKVKFASKPTGSYVDKLILDSSGNLGIGVTPSYKLHVAEGTTDVVASFTSSDANAWIQLRDDHTNDTAVMIGANDDSMMLRAGSNTRMLIAHNGNVGIGTESPKSFANQTSLTIDGSSVGRFDCIAGGGGGGGIYGTATSTKVFANSGATLYVDTATSTDLRLSVGGVDIAKAKNNKDFEIVDGNLVVANGHGIDFSASESSNTTSSSVFADYEEGSWTPADASAAGLSFGNAHGYYTKIGNTVVAHGSVTWPTTSNANTFLITLPFTATTAGSGYTSGSGSVRYTTKDSVVTIHVRDNQSNFSGYAFGGSGITNSNMSTCRFDFTCTYPV